MHIDDFDFYNEVNESMEANDQLRLLNDILEKVLAGDLSYQVDSSSFSGEYERLYNNIRSVLDTQTNYIYEMQAAAGKIMSFTEDLTSTLEESNRFSVELSNNSEAIIDLSNRNYTNTIQAIGSMQELISHLDEIRGSATDARGANDGAGEAIRLGLSQVFSLIGLIGTIEATTAQTVKNLEKLRESAGRITQILKSVDEIARQSQILAINASIESKRAGVEGRSFGIVASAMRDLAHQSQNEVGNIETVVNGITEGLNDLAENIYSDYKNVTQSVESTKTIETNLGHIRDTFGGLSDLIERIAAMTDVETALADSVSAEIASVDENSRRAIDGFNNICRDIDNQKTINHNLIEARNYLQAASNSLMDLTSRSAFSSYDRERIAQRADDALDILRQVVLSHTKFYDMTYTTHKQLLDEILKNDFIEAVWTNDIKGSFIYSNPVAGLLNARAREWFKESAADKTYISEVYISSITRKPCITVSLPVHDASGRLIGVLGADIKIAW